MGLMERRTKTIEAEKSKYTQGIVKLEQATIHVKEM
jgi:hypothetical protein